jgi:hypothetical protein
MAHENTTVPACQEKYAEKYGKNDDRDKILLKTMRIADRRAMEHEFWKKS